MYTAPMDLRQLEIIRAIAETGSFTAAGEKLRVSQSAISRQILLLEAELGETVFHRIGRRIRITPAGESLLQLSHRVFQDLTDTVAGISDRRKPAGALASPCAAARQDCPAHHLARA
jgi:DNA-binding transcriptional LysR family regulator